MMKKLIVISCLVFLGLVLVMGRADAAISWVVSPDAIASGNAIAFGNTVLLGLNEVNSTAGQTQPQGIYGAGFTMTGNAGGAYFDADLYTWDSYVLGAYFDAFVVNVNTQGYYWNLANLTDPVSNAPGATWYWGGQSYVDGALEHYAPLTTNLVSLDQGPVPYYVSVVLDTKTGQSDTQYASWGSFHVTPIPEPTSMMLLGMGILGLFGFKKRS